ncbi:MAG: hypothetical protein WB647_05435 [Roseiarcus sp.]|uniref:hypothetical protein n=1 Tax=Roseiarcus sp. TaxID=1969460 RepID=UPI003C636A60
MTVPLKAARDVKISAKGAKAPLPWAARPITVGLALSLGAAAAGIFGAIEGLRAYTGSDPSPKRWSSVTETETGCYRDLISETPPLSDCVHSDAKAIDPRGFDWVAPHVAVYSAAAAPHSPPTLRDLGDQAQAQAVGFLEKDASVKGGAWATLENALSNSATGAGERDPFRFDRVLVANVAKGVDWRPGDRMMWTRVLVEPINFTFAGYSVASTENETQKIGSVEKTDSRKFSADLSSTIPGIEGPKASVGPSSEHTVKASSDVNAQYEKLGIDIMPGFLRIMRESETGGDAVGNTEVSLTAVTDPEMIWKRFPRDEPLHQSAADPIVLLVTGTHFDGDGVAERSDAGNETHPTVDVLPQVPVPHCALRARVWMLYEERRVDSGRASYDESRQAVTLAHDAQDKQDVDIMAADEVSPAVWALKLCTTPKCEDKEERLLKAKVQPDPPGPENPDLWRNVVFTDYGVAIRLAHWLRTHQDGRPPNTSYLFNFPSDSNGAYVSLVPVKTKGDECKGEKLEKTSSR